MINNTGEINNKDRKMNNYSRNKEYEINVYYKGF